MFVLRSIESGGGGEEPGGAQSLNAPRSERGYRKRGAVSLHQSCHLLYSHARIAHGAMHCLPDTHVCLLAWNVNGRISSFSNARCMVIVTLTELLAQPSLVITQTVSKSRMV